MKIGIQYAVKEAFIGRLLLVFGLFIFLCVPAGFLATLFVSRYYKDTYWSMTLVEVIDFIGMTAGGILIGAWGGFKNRMKTLTVGLIAFGTLAIGMGAVDSFAVYLLLMAVYGVCSVCSVRCIPAFCRWGWLYSVRWQMLFPCDC